MTSAQKSVEKAYEWLSPVYNFVYGKLAFGEGREKAIELLEIRSGDRVLEVGVGTGLTLPMYPRDCEVMGVDVAEGMLKEARELITKQNLSHAQVQPMDAASLEFPDNSFDRVLGNLFISATNDPVGSMEEMKRVCKPGGLIVLMNHFKSENEVIGRLEEVFDPIARNIGFTSKLELEPLLQKVGLTVKRMEKVNFFNLWTAVSLINNKGTSPDQ